MKPAILLLATSLMAPLVSHAAIASSPEKQQIAIQNQPGLGPAMALVNGTPAVLYNAPDQHITYQQGSHTVVLDKTAPVVGGQYLKLDTTGNAINALWWSHEGQKALYFSRSTDGGKTFSKTAIVNDDHGVLYPFHLAADGNNLGMVYNDERSPKYEIYFNRSTDGGKTWQRPDQRLDTPPAIKDADSVRFEPQMAAIGNRWVVVWRDPGDSAMAQFNYQSLLMRTSTDNGKTWSEEKHIYSTKQVMSQLTLKALDGHFVLAFAEGDGIRLMSAKADAADWTRPLSVPGFNSTSGGDIKLAAGNQNKLTVVWSGQLAESKAAIFSSGFDLAKSAWLHDAVRVDTKEINNTQSLSPSLVSLPNGIAVAAWTDYRNILPEVYVATSRDNGATWSKAQNVGINGADSMSTPTLAVEKNAVFLGYQAHINNKPDELYYVTMPLQVTDNGEITGLPEQKIYSESYRADLLKKRVMELWAYRQKADFPPTYQFFDPAFRAAISQDLFDRSQAQIAYQDVKWIGADIKGNVGNAKVSLKLKVMPMEVNGKKIDLPEQKSEVKADWLWIKDNWYLQYIGIQNQRYLTY